MMKDLAENRQGPAQAKSLQRFEACERRLLEVLQSFAKPILVHPAYEPAPLCI